MYHRSWTTQDGAPNSISSLAIGGDGLLWLATDDGLFRFNGLSFMRYKPSDGNALLSDHLKSISSAPDGSIWISYLFGGFSKLSGGHVINFTERDGLPPGQAQSIAVDDKGLWFINSENLYRLIDGRTTSPRSPSGESWAARGVIVDRSNNVWLVLDHKVMVLPAGGHDFRLAANSPHAKQIGCWRGGVEGVDCDDRAGWQVSLQYATGQILTTSSQLEERAIKTKNADLNSIYGHFSARDGSMWATTFGHGVVRIAAEALRTPQPEVGLESFTVKDGLTSNFTFSILEDREGSVWVATERGLDQFRATPIQTANIEAANTQAMARERHSGQVLLAANRLASIAGDKASPLTEVYSGLGSRSIYAADDGNVWIGAKNSLWRFAGGKIATYPMPTELRGDLDVVGVQSITEDAQHRIWISVTRNGVFAQEGDTWRQRGGHDGLPNLTPVCLGRDHRGDVWLGYLDGQVAAISKEGGVRHWSSLEGPQIGAVKVFAQFGDDLLIGGDQGVSYEKDGRFRPLKVQGATTLRGVTGLAVASNGDLWANGSMGIAHITKGDLARAVMGPGFQTDIELFDYHDGIHGMPSPLAGLGSVVQGSDGDIYFSMRTELDWVSPGGIQRNPFPPAVTIDEIRSNQRSILWPTIPFELAPNPETIEIRYDGGSLLIPDRVRFKYRLENYDQDWVDAGNRREAFYSKLPPGRYTFRVLAANDAGVWNNTGASVTFTVRPTFFETSWFKLACVIAMLLIFVVFSRVRLNATKRRIANHMYEILTERQRIARDLHDTLLQSVQALMFKIAIATRKLPEGDPVKPILETTLAQSDEVLAEGRRLISSLQMKEEPSGALLDVLRTIGEELQSAYPVTQFVVETEGAERVLSTVVNPEVCIVGREALTNAFRHANAKHVWLSLYATAEELRVGVRDDGNGIEETVLTRGFRTGHWGLRNMRERTERLGGRFTLKSSPEYGTSIEIAVPAFVAYKDAPHGVRGKIRKLLH